MLGNQGTAGRRRLLLRFDLAALPPQAVVTAATLWLDKSAWTVAEHPVTVYALQRPWHVELASWSVRGLEPWTPWRWESAGAGSVGDRGAAVVTGHAPKAPGWERWEIGPLVQRWVDGAAENLGLLLVADESEELLRYTSSEGDCRQASDAVHHLPAGRA